MALDVGWHHYKPRTSHIGQKMTDIVQFRVVVRPGSFFRPSFSPANHSFRVFSFLGCNTWYYDETLLQVANESLQYQTMTDVIVHPLAA